MTDDTRRLSAAAYLDPKFASTVVGEYIYTRRSVAPSIGIDLGAILRHCLRARRLILIRDLVMAALVLAGLVTSLVGTLDFLIVATVLGGVLPGWGGRGVAGRTVAGLGALAALGLAFTLTTGSVLTSFSSLTAGGSLAASLTSDLRVVAVFVFLLIAIWAAEFGYNNAIRRTLSAGLLHGKPPPPGRGPAERRVAEVEAAQYGNVTLYRSENPFIGAGAEIGRHWSIAIELVGDAAAGPDGAGGEMTGGHLPRAWIPIDPADAHEAIRERLLRLRDEDLLPGERVPGLAVHDHVVGSGRAGFDGPLQDPANGVPYAYASPEAIDALIHTPQAGLRYYLRATVLDWGPPVMSAGRPVIAFTDHGIAVSAFVYVAVEGRMFYLQFVRTVLPPVRSEYETGFLHSSQRLMARRARREMFRSLVTIPARIRSAIRTAAEERSVTGWGYPGTSLSVRELGAADNLGTHIRRLDVEKYTAVIERVLLDTVMDFLKAKGVDISDFRAAAGSVVTVFGGNNQFGSNNQMTNNMPAQGTGVQASGRSR
jgi:hypothetical protein